MAWTNPRSWVQGELVTADLLNVHLRDNLLALQETPTSPPGIVHQYAGATAPTGYLMCDGSEVSRTTYAALYAAIGIAYGSGNGTTTFNLPDMRGRVPVGKGTHADVDTLGEHEGVSLPSRRPRHAHSVSDPGHAHSVYDPTHAHSVSDPGHSHGVTDPGHTHSVDAGNVNVGYADSMLEFQGWENYQASKATSLSTTGISVNGATTGVGVNGAATGIGIYGAATGIGVGTAGVTDSPAYIVVNYIIKT